jgi:hypothetical protein
MTIDWFEHRLGLVTAGVTRWSGAPYGRTFDPAGALLHKFPIVLEWNCPDLVDTQRGPR